MLAASYSNKYCIFLKMLHFGTEVFTLAALANYSFLIVFYAVQEFEFLQFMLLYSTYILRMDGLAMAMWD
jgi:hypothetical protein